MSVTNLCNLLLFVASLCAITTTTSVLAVPSQSTTLLSSNATSLADSLIEFFTTGPGKGQTYDKLAKFTDNVGHRLCGDPTYDRAAVYLKELLAEDKLENIHGEAATVPRWTRGQESLEMISPRSYNMNILSLGLSVGTPPEGITGEILVVSSFDELTNRSAEAKGKIVVYNQYCDWEAKPVACYGESVDYRSAGASEASKVGAIASLIRTVGSFSIDSPHTGHQAYDSGVTPIPTACITIEDAEMLARMQARGTSITLKLKMEAANHDPVQQDNIIAEWTGSEFPDEIVLVSGHLDSWDVGQGAMDDGGGMVISWQVLSALQQLNIRPKRTIRLVAWACEEMDGIGSGQYFNNHKAEAANMSIAMESDMGAFTPKGIQFTGNADATKVMEQVVSLLAPINAAALLPDGSDTDNGPWGGVGVPLGALATYNDKYFYFHHSNGDMMTIFNATELDLAAATWAVTAAVIADLPSLLPRNTTN